MAQSEVHANGREEYPEDLVGWIEQRLTGSLSDPIKVLEAQYETALNELVPLLLAHTSAGELSEQVERLVRRITRHFLFNYYSGFMLYRFTPPYRDKTIPTARQRAIEGALHKLAQYYAARELMADFFIGALQHRLHRMMREFLNAHKSTLHPRRALNRTIARFMLADRWEILGQYNQTVYQSVPFGLSGFYLLFSSTQLARPEEFEALIKYASRLARRNEWWSLPDVIRVVTSATLSSDQLNQLLDLVLGWLSIEGYSHERHPMAEIADRQQHPASPASNEYPAFREQHNLNMRHEESAKILGMLAGQSHEALRILEENGLVDTVMKELLPLAINHLPIMETIVRHLGKGSWTRLLDDDLEALRGSRHLLGGESAECLLHVIRENENACPWAVQILNNIPGLTEEADWHIARRVADEGAPAVLGALIQMCRSLRDRPGRFPRELEGALLARLITLLFDPEIRLRAEWVSFLGINGGSPLEEVLEKVRITLQESSSSPLRSRSPEILRAIAAWAEQIPHPDAMTLAACWLVQPTDDVEGISTVIDRVQQAISFLNRPADRTTQQAVVHILDSVIELRPAARKVIAQALPTLRYPELALPLLERLFKIAGSGDRYNQDPKLYAEAFKAVASLKPLLPESLFILEHGLQAADDRESHLYSALTPAFVYDQVLPLLIHDISPEAIPVLIEFVWRNHCAICSEKLPWTAYERRSLRLVFNEKAHRYMHMPYGEGFYADGLMVLCALQSLANVANLSVPQQRIIWRLYRTSWHALTKSLCLLILSRQRPIREETVLAMMRILHQDPFSAVIKTVIQYLFRSLLFRLVRRQSAPDGHVNHTLLCQSIAVNFIHVLVGQHRDEALVKKHRHHLEKALLSVVSLRRYGMEPHLAEYTSLGTSASGTQALGQMMGATPEETAQAGWRPSWIAHPADMAYRALQDLGAEKALADEQN